MSYYCDIYLRFIPISENDEIKSRPIQTGVGANKDAIVPAKADIKMRDTSDRRRIISELVKEKGSVQVIGLSERFGVSTQTIRKDLLYLSERGVVTRSYGGAISTDVVGNQKELAVETKRMLHPTTKDKIGAHAAKLVSRGEAIILDSGTTTASIARHLPDDESLTVVSNDYGVMTELITKQNINSVMLGGALRRHNMAFYGALTEAALERLAVDTLFLGVDGLDLERGITTHHESEAMLNRRMISIARRVIAVTDSSKVAHVCLHKIIGLSEIETLVIDTGAPEELIRGAQDLGVNIALVDVS